MMLRLFVARLSPQISQVPKVLLRTTACLQTSFKPPIQPSVLKIANVPLPETKSPSPLKNAQKKRSQKKRARLASPNILAYSTCEEYHMEAICQKLTEQGLYDVKELPEETEALHAQAHYILDGQQRDIFFFKEGSVVFWNFTEVEAQTVLNVLKSCETGPYEKQMIEEELETMEFQFHNAKTRVTNGKVLLNQNLKQDTAGMAQDPAVAKDAGVGTEPKTAEQGETLEKYAFSNGIALSVKLAIWEAILDKYVESIEHMLEDIRHGRKLAATREHVFRKTGELFALRHQLNLSSDYLDIPDFYWDRNDLEWIFTKTIRLYSIERRTKVMNEKINHCQELMELLSHHLEDKHHVRLEVMIILLIVIEVIFECLHYAERYQHAEE